MTRKLLICGLLFCICFELVAQNNSQFNSDRDKFSLRFTNVNNLIVIPVELNEVNKINMVLDTGSPYTLIVDFDYLEELTVKEGKQITIGGLGHGIDILAYDSRFNHLQMSKAKKEDAHLILILNSNLNLSKYLGMPVHGIIGFDAFKDYVVEINYLSQKIKFYKHDYFYKRKKRKLKKFKAIPLDFQQKKPYINAEIFNNGQSVKNANLLVDTGGWDALWWFKNSSINFDVPVKSYQDTLGHGINGAITGLRAKTDKFKLSNFEFQRPTTSFPDSISLANAVTFEGRNGSLGGEILRRFHVIFDYKNQLMYLKPNKNYHDEFHYDMSGVKLHKPFAMLPFLEVISVRNDSPGYHAGISEGDLITSVNGEDLSEGDLGKINHLLRTKPGKRVKFEILRNGRKMIKSFVLADDL